MASEKIRGKAKKVAGMIKGETGILGTLRQEHGEVASLMHQIRSRDDGDLHLRDELFQKLRTQLLVHAKAEQAVFYSECMRYQDLQQAMVSSEQQHAEIEQLLQQLATTPLEAPGWVTTFETLERRVLEHVKHEEAEVFRLAKHHMERDELRRLDQQYENEKQVVERKLPESEGPSAPMGEYWP